LNEELILPREATRCFPPGPDGKRIHVSAIYRYMKVGTRGVVLESLNAPRKCTSREAIGRFMDRLNNHALPGHPATRSGAGRPRVDRRVEGELDRLGL
jgi:hypothetical protein